MVLVSVVCPVCFCRSSFSEFAAKYSKDERFKAVERMREREQLFNEFLVEMKKSAAKQREEQKISTKTKADKVRPVAVKGTVS